MRCGSKSGEEEREKMRGDVGKGDERKADEVNQSEELNFNVSLFYF